MVRGIIIVMCLSTSALFAQQTDYIRPGLIKLGATISPGIMLNRPATNYYLSGFLEGFLEKKISLRGETHFFIDGAEDVPYFKNNLRTNFGLVMHKNKNNLDFHLALMPGLDVMEVNGDRDSEGRQNLHAVPSFAINVGMTFYVWKIFNFFAEANYMYSTVNSLRGINGRSDEILISAGLSFNVNLIREKK